MPVKKAIKSRILDQKDREILMILQENGRESMTKIAKKVGLSIDSVNNRIKAMLEKKIFFTGIFIDPRAIGFPLIVDVMIKVGNVTEKARDEFVAHLMEHPRIISLLSTTGDNDFDCVLIAKDTNELEKISLEIRNRFKELIKNWSTTLYLKTYKLERYNLLAGE